MGDRKRIVCVTPNVSVDRTYFVNGLAPGWVARAAEAAVDCGGKGVNVARAARVLGAEPVCTGFLAGNTGRTAADLARGEGLECRWTWVDGETRTNVIIVGTAGGEATVINAPGPAVGAGDWDRLKADVLAEAELAECVCLCGSLPPGCKPSDMASLVADLGAMGRPVWVDSSGAALAGALAGNPAGVKINASEAGDLLGRGVDTAEEAIAAAIGIRDRGPAAVVVTLGRAGAVAVVAGEVWQAVPPALDADNPVGSGDSFLGGLVSAMLAGVPSEEALRQATAAGSASAMQRSRSGFTTEHFKGLLAKIAITKVC